MLKRISVGFGLALLLCPATAAATGGGHALQTMEDLPSDIAFTEGVPESVMVDLTTHARPSTTLCAFELFARITIPGPIETGQPCYGGAAPSIPGIDGGYCPPGVGDAGELYAMGGGAYSSPGATTDFQLELIYDGSSPTTRHGEWELFTDGRCGELSEPEYRKIGSINIHILPPGQMHEDSYIATATGSAYNFFYLDHPQLNGNPNARILVTPLAVGGVATDLNYGVWYNSWTGRWSIYNESGAAMVDGRRFLVAFGGERSFIHTSTSTNASGNLTRLDDPRLNDNPYAAVFVTHNWNPPGVGGNYHDHATGVWYDNGTRRWTIYNEDWAIMDAGHTWNVIVASDVPPGVTGNVWEWPASSGLFVAPSIFEHEYLWPSAAYFVDTPVSSRTDIASCLNPPWDHICTEQTRPASAAGVFPTSRQFFAWTPDN